MLLNRLHISRIGCIVLLAAGLLAGFASAPSARQALPGDAGGQAVQGMVAAEGPVEGVLYGDGGVPWPASLPSVLGRAPTLVPDGAPRVGFGGQLLLVCQPPLRFGQTGQVALKGEPAAAWPLYRLLSVYRC